MKKIKLWMVAATIVSAIGCTQKAEEPTLQVLKTEYTIVSGDNQTIEVLPNKEGCVFVPNSYSIVGVTNDGIVTGRTLGETYISVRNGARNFSMQCKIKVVTNNIPFGYPFLDVDDKNVIKQKEAEAGRVFLEERDFPEVKTSFLIFKDNTNELIDEYQYVFKESKLYSCQVVGKFSNGEKIKRVLGEKYLLKKTPNRDDMHNLLNPADPNKSLGSYNEHPDRNQYAVVLLKL